MEDTLNEALSGRAILALEDGRVFNGRAAGARTRRGGEVVFNTSLTGYQEVFTDPSYSGQIVCLTYPHIGNVGTNLDDEESTKPYIEALIVREFSVLASNWRSSETAHKYLERYGVPVIYFDRRFAESGGLISYGSDFAAELSQAAGYIDRILNGAKPADLPIQTPTKFELIINLKTVKALGLTVPPLMLGRADDVIE